MDQPSPQEQLNRMLTGYWISQALYVAAKLGVADLVKDGPRTPNDLASATKAHAPALYRLLRALASVGVFAEDGQGRFSMTPLAECLRSNVPGSQRALAIMTGEEQFRAWSDLLYSVQTGKTCRATTRPSANCSMDSDGPAHFQLSRQCPRACDNG